MKKSAEEGCKFVHFADLDFFGIEHFSSISECLGDSVDLWNTPTIDVEYYRRFGDKELFDKQKGEFNQTKIGKIVEINENAKLIYNNIKATGYCIHQERLHELFFS